MNSLRVSNLRDMCFKLQFDATYYSVNQPHSLQSYLRSQRAAAVADVGMNVRLQRQMKQWLFLEKVFSCPGSKNKLLAFLRSD